jgi:hypothetical protein
MRLITEQIDQDLEFFVEATEAGKKNLYISGIFMQSEAKNRNGRIYEKKILESAVDKYIDSQVLKGRAVGELNHPDTPTINLDKVSHLITKLEWNGNDVVGKAKILETPMGNIARSLIEGGVKLGVSTRGMGSLIQKNGSNYVGEDFMLSTVDIVQDPSAHSAFVEGIMEGAEWVYDAVANSWLKQEKLAETVRELKQNRIDEAKAIREFKNILFKL